MTKSIALWVASGVGVVLIFTVVVMPPVFLALTFIVVGGLSSGLTGLMLRYGQNRRASRRGSSHDGSDPGGNIVD